MLLLHQIGSVKIGEVVRYTVTYTPSHDRILPSPEVLHLRIRNTSAVALRAAFVHGPYTLNVAAYPSHFDPNTKFEDPRRYGVPEFEPMLKAGGSWSCELVVPEDIRQSAGLGINHSQFGGPPEDASVSWVVEVASQVIFSSSAAVGYEVLLARDEKSFNLSSSSPVIGSNQAQITLPGKVSDFQQSVGAKDGLHSAQQRGVFSRAVRLKVEDTASLWNTPRLPGWDEWARGHKHAALNHDVATDVAGPSQDTSADAERSAREEQQIKSGEKKRKRVHLVVLTHGLHSNLGADMLYLKESIDATVKQAKMDARARRAREKAEREAAQKQTQAHVGGEPSSNAEDEPRPETSVETAEEEEYDDEEVIVRGFSGNATRTERGIKYLGKRLARYILSMTYPDQPYLPSSKKAAEGITTAFKADADKSEGKPAHKHSTIHLAKHYEQPRPFQITSISFIGHSLGGLVQTYAIAYIQKHSPQFFDLIRPINFIALASPLLGLSNENPLYVKFALDTGLVGRTGQDLGLTWRAPTIARSSWGAIVSTLGESAHKKVMGEVQPESKPLLRILPTGPAHAALKKFRNRTVYSNVVNDGIVPLRTSCLLFLDWQGLGRVEKARREAGLVESVLGFGWAELTGANVTSPRKGRWTPEGEDGGSSPKDTSSPTPPSPGTDTDKENSREVPQPSSNVIIEDDRQSVNLYHENPPQSQSDGPFSNFFNFFRSKEPSPPSPLPTSPRPSSPKDSKIFKRSQTLRLENDSASSSKSRVTTGMELDEDQKSSVSAPPRTSFFESAGDLLNPKLPSVEYLIDPSKRHRAIFHDRVYHPADIPSPPLKKRPTGSLTQRQKTKSSSSGKSPKLAQGDRTWSGSSSPYLNPQHSLAHEDTGLSVPDYDDLLHTSPDHDPDEIIDSSNMSVEEKIARAYHKGLSWRKVLVKLEPDAHNNIIVRRMFANAHGWPVVKHLCDAHFSDAAAARMPDDKEQSTERARPLTEHPDKTGAETTTQTQTKHASSGDGTTETAKPGHLLSGQEIPQSPSEAREAEDKVPELPEPGTSLTLRSSHSGSDRSNPLLQLPGSPATSPPRPTIDRLDSVTWSERDWADSGDDSDSDVAQHLVYGDIDGGKGKEKEKEKEVPSRAASPSWTWTEKIVGKGKSAGKGRKTSGPNSPTLNTTAPKTPTLKTSSEEQTT
jgi:hypothetical protein